MLNIGLSIVQNRVASSLSTAFADFGANPSIIAADADQDALFLSDASTGNVLTSVSLSEFGAPTNGSGFIGFDKSGNAIEYSDGELPRTWDASNNQWIWMTDPAVTRLNALSANSVPVFGSITRTALAATGDLTPYRCTASSGSDRLSPVAAKTSGTAYTMAVSLKNITGTPSFQMYADTSTVTCVPTETAGDLTPSVGGTWTNGSARMVAEGGGWFRLELTATAGETGSSADRLIIDTGGSGSIDIRAIQTTATDKFPGWVGGDQTVGNVDREALEWFLGSRAVAAVQAATDLTLGLDFVETGGTYTSPNIPALAYIKGAGDGIELYALVSNFGVSDTTSSGRTTLSNLGNHDLPGKARLAVGVTASSTDIRASGDGDPAATVSTFGSLPIDWSEVTEISFGSSWGSWNRDLPGGINKIAIAAVDTSNADLEAWSGL